MSDLFEIALQWDVIFLFAIFIEISIIGWWNIFSSILKWIQKKLEKKWLREFEEEQNARNQ